ncbi:MAG: dihydroorotate dehydrogenase [Rhodocyclaceae bacterium]|nr:dihydroorotate dehydrogenase [Rhodocyclaceae bacterium]
MSVAAPAFALGIGLAGGIDRDGRRARELLAAGFDSVEFGSVAAGIDGFPDDGAATLAARLAAQAHGDGPRIGVGLGRPPGAPPAALVDCWTAGLEAVAGVADYVSLNLTAAANRPLLAPEYRPLLARAFAAVAARRDALAAGGHRVDLAVKLPLDGPGEPLPTVGLLAVAAGFERLTLVRSDGDAGFARFAELVRQIDGRAAPVAVGGIRSAADVAAAREAGAAGVQVHRLYAERGAACLAGLRAAT